MVTELRTYLTASTNSKLSLHNHVLPAIGDGNRPSTGRLHYSSHGSAVISSRSQLKRNRKQSNCGVGIVGQEVSFEFYHCSPFANTDYIVLIQVSGLSPVSHVLQEWMTHPLRKKSNIWLVIWFRQNTSI